MKQPPTSVNKPLMLLPLQTSVTFPSRVNHLIRAAFCHGFFFLTASLDENQAVFMFILLVVCPLASERNSSAIGRSAPMATGCSGAPNHPDVMALCTGSQPLACSPPGVFSVAVV